MIPRAIPRFPGPKLPWSAWATSTTLGPAVVFGLPTSSSPGDYWLERVDAIQLASGASGTTFSMWTNVTQVGGAPDKYFFAGQVSPNTGIYFPWRGLLRIDGDVYFNNAGGNWGLTMSGFLTTNVNAAN